GVLTGARDPARVRGSAIALVHCDVRLPQDFLELGARRGITGAIHEVVQSCAQDLNRLTVAARPPRACVRAGGSFLRIRRSTNTQPPRTPRPPNRGAPAPFTASRARWSIIRSLGATPWIAHGASQVLWSGSWERRLALPVSVPRRQQRTPAAGSAFSEVRNALDVPV